MANELITTSNPFLRAAGQLRTKGTVDRAAATEPVQRSVRARLNFIPDNDMIATLVDRALEALSKGRIWDRGAILNLTV